MMFWRFKVIFYVFFYYFVKCHFFNFWNKPVVCIFSKFARDKFFVFWFPENAGIFFFCIFAWDENPKKSTLNMTLTRSLGQTFLILSLRPWKCQISPSRVKNRSGLEIISHFDEIDIQFSSMCVALKRPPRGSDSPNLGKSVILSKSG